MRFHTGDKPHSCETCGRGKSFAPIGSLKKHILYHMQDNSNICI